MWQTKYAAAGPKNLGVGVNFWPCSAVYSYFLSGRPWSVVRCPWSVVLYDTPERYNSPGPFLFVFYKLGYDTHDLV